MNSLIIRRSHFVGKHNGKVMLCTPQPFRFRNYFIDNGEYFLYLKVDFWQADDDPNGPPCAKYTLFEHTRIIVEGNSITTAYRQYQNAHKMKVTVLNSSDLSKIPTLRIRISVFVRRFY